MELSTWVRAELGLAGGYILPWTWFHGCQLMSRTYRAALSCPYREAVWQCEVIGEHSTHRWSDHLIAHERFGNGHPCSTVGGPDTPLKDSMARLYPWSRIGQPMILGHEFEGDGENCTGWIEGSMGGGDAGTITYRLGCGWPRSAHEVLGGPLQPR